MSGAGLPSGRKVDGDPARAGERLVVDAISKHIGKRIVLAEVDLVVSAGEVVALTGENGAGKVDPDEDLRRADPSDERRRHRARRLAADHCQRWRDDEAVVVVTHMLAELDRVDRVVELPVHQSRQPQPTS